MQLLDLVQVKLIQHGYILLHGVALSNGRESALIVAPSESGKTVTSLLGMQKGYSLMSDDMLVSDGTLLFPAMSPVPPRVYSEAFLNLMTGVKPKVVRFTGKILYLLGLGALNGVLLSTEALIPQGDIETQPVHLTHIFFLNKGEDFGITPVEKSEARRRLEHSHKAEFVWRANPLIRAYAYFRDNLDITHIERMESALLDKVVDRSNCFVCQSPTPYRFIELIQKEFRL